MKKNQVRTVFMTIKLTQMTETFLYHTAVKPEQKDKLSTAKKDLAPEEIRVTKETQLLAWKPKISAQTSKGIRAELKITNIVQMVVLVSMPDDLESGLTKLTSLSTINPKMKLVKLDVIITAYWIPCDTWISVRQGEQTVLIALSLNEAIRLASQQHLRASLFVLAWAYTIVLMVTTFSQLLAWEPMQMEHTPMIVQVMARKSRMMKQAKHPLNILLQELIQKAFQFISQGVGTFQFFISSFYPLKRYFYAGSFTQQQQQLLMHE